MHFESSAFQLRHYPSLASFVKDIMKNKIGVACKRGQPGGSRHRKRPRVSIPMAGSRDRLCSQHNIPLEMYCCTDAKCICPMCALFEHTRHKVVDVSEERQTRQEELKKRKTQICHQRLQMEGKEWTNLRGHLKHIQHEAQATEDYCDSIIAQLIDCLQRHYGTIKELVEAQKSAAIAEAQSTMQNLDTRLKEQESIEAELNDLLSTDDDVYFLQTWPHFMSHCEASDIPSVSECNLLHFESIKEAVKQFGRLVEEFCDKEIHAISQNVCTHAIMTASSHTEPTVSYHTEPTVSSHTGPAVNSHTGPAVSSHTEPEVNFHTGPAVNFHTGPAVSSHTEPEVNFHTGPAVSSRTRPAVSSRTGPAVSSHIGPAVSSHARPTVSHTRPTHTGLTSEPQTRAEFLEYACELTLDPNTAHEDLVVSEDQKRVKMSSLPTGGTRRHSEQFVYRRQVLCEQGLQAERCYYEVEVYGEKAEIALAYKGIDRKSRTRLSAFGGDDKSWSLDRCRTYSVSHKSQSVLLTSTPCQRRIGVYLKFREGTLTFYEVSDNMEFLYRVETRFREPLYPGFWLEKNGCIRLCDLRKDK